MNNETNEQELVHTLAPDELLDKTLYLMLQLTEEERISILSDYAERYGWYVV